MAVDSLPRPVTDRTPSLSPDRFYDVLESVGRPVVTAAEVARELDVSQAAADEALRAAGEAGVDRFDASGDPVVWYPTDWTTMTERERVVVFPERRELVVSHPTQFTRARVSQFARLVTTNGEGGYVYEVRREDVWNAPFRDLDSLLGAVRAVAPERYPALEEYVADQWRRAHRFRLYTHSDGYTVLEAATDELMGNVARQRLGADHLHGPIDDDASWVVDGAEAAIKRTLYEAGYPVQDDRDLETGDPLEVDLRLELRDYQRDWVERFLDAGSGVLVGPSGSGKTVAAMGVLAAVGGETLVLVPSRELAAQWREELLAHTTLTPGQVGEYHGGAKQLRPVTVATYQIAGMDRHRSLFDDRRWGLVVYDEAHHVPSPVARVSADLQSTHRLGLTASPVREDEKETDIYTLIGPPVGTDWDALFEAGHVAEPEVEIRYVPMDDDAEAEHGAASGHERRRVAATNPAKLDAVRDVLAEHPERKTLVFVEYLDQGDEIAAALDAPFVSGETPHSERARLFREFRAGQRQVLVVSRVGDEGIDLPDAEVAVLASGLGGSRRQGTQRAGRTMRPAGESLVYVLATRGTREEEFARRQTRHLAGRGVEVREREA
ncbi:MAG: DEAD/DEAH box helicase [Halobacteriaceae archaeon]